MHPVFWSKRRREQQEAIEDARRACLQKGATIYTALKDDSMGVSEYLTLTPEEFQCIRMFAREERPEVILDCVWQVVDGTETYRVRLDWDISEITDIF